MSVGGESGVGGASARNVGAPELSNVIGESWMRVFFLVLHLSFRFVTMPGQHL